MFTNMQTMTVTRSIVGYLLLDSEISSNIDKIILSHTCYNMQKKQLHHDAHTCRHVSVYRCIFTVTFCLFPSIKSCFSVMCLYHSI